MSGTPASSTQKRPASPSRDAPKATPPSKTARREEWQGADEKSLNPGHHEGSDAISVARITLKVKGGSSLSVSRAAALSCRTIRNHVEGTDDNHFDLAPDLGIASATDVGISEQHARGAFELIENLCLSGESVATTSEDECVRLRERMEAAVVRKGYIEAARLQGELIRCLCSSGRQREAENECAKQLDINGAIELTDVAVYLDHPALKSVLQKAVSRSLRKLSSPAAVRAALNIKPDMSKAEEADASCQPLLLPGSEQELQWDTTEVCLLGCSGELLRQLIGVSPEWRQRARNAAASPEWIEAHVDRGRMVAEIGWAIRSPANEDLDELRSRLPDGVMRLSVDGKQGGWFETPSCLRAQPHLPAWWLAQAAPLCAQSAA